MASVTTYLLVSGANEQEAVRTHSVVEDGELEVHDTREKEADRLAGITLKHESPLEDRADLSEAAQTLSAAFPDAIVLLCEVEERFDHIERLQTKMYSGGKDAGHIEHGYVFNIGGA